MRIRNSLYDRGILKVKKLPVPVISVGNLSLGGSGKTSTVMFLAEELSRDLRVTVLMRGYRRRSKGVRVVSEWGNVLMGVDEAGDEAYMIGRLLSRISVVVAEDRYEGGVVAVRDLGTDLIILDDGFQHRRLCRDLDIVLLKRSDLTDRIFPAGRLREPLSSLKRADAIVLSYQEVYPFDFEADVPVFRMRRVFTGLLDPDFRVVSLDILSDREVIAFSGLGDNAQFLKTLQKLNIRVKEFLSFPDHHRYRDFELKEGEVYLTTPKDLVKLPNVENLYALYFKVRIPGLVEFVRSRLHL